MQTLADIPRHQAATRPDAVALVFEGRETTYAAFDRRTSEVANALIAEGLGPGARVAILAKNTDRFFEIFFGAVKARAVLVPVNFRLAPPEVAYVVDDATAELLFVDAEHADLIAGIADGFGTVRRIVHLDGGQGDWIGYDDWCAGAPGQDPELVVAPADVAIQMYTSGTTGRPKGVQLTHDNLICASEMTSEQVGDWSAADVNLVCMPLYHIAGSGWGMVGLYNGTRNIVLPEVDPARILRLIETERVTKALFVPAVILFLMQTPTCRETDFTSMNLIAYGASPIPLDLLAEAIRTVGCDFIQLYGLTETTGAIVYLPAADHDPAGGPRMRACGVPMRGVEIKIVDPQGNQVGPGVVGEIASRSRFNMLGYWNLPEADAAAFRDGWFHSGDAGYLDEDGYLYIHDRIKDMILSGAENIYPAEVESALFEHAAVADVAVIGVPDDKWGEAVKAVVVPVNGAEPTEAELQAFARERIAGYKVPKSIDFVTELPRNPSGKILKRELRAPYWEDEDRQVR